MFKLIQGDCVKVLAGLAEGSVDAVVTDPPYGLEFMGKEWDSFKTVESWDDRTQRNAQDGFKQNQGFGNMTKNKPIPRFEAGSPFQSWCSSWGRECLRVLKPGGFLLAFGGTRTHHRLTCGLEDAGFIVRDELMWGYASGFPKAQALDKLIDKKLGVDGEREVVGDLKTHRTHRDNPLGEMLHLGDGKETAPASPEAAVWVGWKTPALKPAWEPIVLCQKPCEGSITENVLKHEVGGFNIDACRIPINDGERIPRGNIPYEMKADNNFGGGHDARKGTITETFEEGGRFPSNLLLTDGILADGYNKFFLIPKAGASEKHENPFGDAVSVGESELAFASANASGQFYNKTKNPSPSTKKNFHPTVKPLRLMEHLIKLVTREGAVVLDPFLGSGTTLLACRALNRSCIGVEQSKEYCDIVKARFGNSTLGEPLEVVGP